MAYQIVGGDTDGNLNPQAFLTRAEMAALLYKLSNYTPPADLDPGDLVQPEEDPQPGGTADPGQAEGPGQTADPDQPEDPGQTSQPEEPAVPVEGITLDTGELTLQAGSSYHFTPTLSPEGAAGTVVWTSSVPTVAPVTSDGTITNLNTTGGQVSVTITASCGDACTSAVVLCDTAASAGTVRGAENGLNVRFRPQHLPLCGGLSAGRRQGHPPRSAGRRLAPRLLPHPVRPGRYRLCLPGLYRTGLISRQINSRRPPGDAGGLLCFLIYPLCVQLRCLLQKNSASTEVKIPHTQMAMELMAPWRGPISRALEVPTAWLLAPMATPSATGSVMRKHLANRGASMAPSTPVMTTAAAVMPGMPPPALRDAQRDGCGDTLRQHGGSKHLLGAEQPAQQQHGAHAGGAARQTPCQHGEKVFPQHLPLLIDIQGQHRGGRAQHQLYQPAAGIVALHGDA